eukprot:10281764-Ditylum_brightwellii.AAC.1
MQTAALLDERSELIKCISQFEALSSRKDSQISDLLQTLQEVEGAFVVKTRQYEDGQDQLFADSRSISNEVDCLKRELTLCQSANESALKKEKNMHNQREKDWLRIEQELNDNIKSNKREISDLEQRSERNKALAAKKLEDVNRTVQEMHQQIDHIS